MNKCGRQCVEVSTPRLAWIDGARDNNSIANDRTELLE
jgi:hypothetical protein